MPTPHPLVPGSRFGPYEIVREIGLGKFPRRYYLAAGGLALEVFDAFAFDAECDDWLAMRVDEARLATILDHPNLARLHTSGRIGRQLFLAHEYIDGESVRQLQHRRGHTAWAPEAAIALALGLTAGLGYLHDATTRDGEPLHWVHRKLDPTTVFVTRDGTVKLTDFAMSHGPPPGVLDPRISRYLSPEQLRGWPLDRRSDLFSLGALLYELTTTRRPFDGPDDYSMMAALFDGPLAPPSALVADYSPRLERIVERSLERDRDRRYQTAGELERALREVAQAESLDVSARVLASLLA